jgi:hypothetical protein
MNHQPISAPFLIITPAHNEAALIGKTITSMIDQLVRPVRWVVVNDNSSDGTADIVREHAARHDFIQLVNYQRSGTRSFGQKARAFEAGRAAAASADYAYIGNLDADISLAPDYFQRLLREFDAEPRLGLAGGRVASLIDANFVDQNIAPDSVAGAVQLFRRACFEGIGGYLALPEGGIDSAAEIMARMQGWQVRTLSDLRVLEHRRTGSATAPPLVARFKEGACLQSLGYGFLFMILRSLHHLSDRPRLIGSTATIAGYLRRLLSGSPEAIPPEVVRFLRHEQQQKLLNSLKGLYVRHLRHP